MKKFQLLILLIFINVNHCFSQLDKKVIGPITTKIGILLKENDTLLLGRGSNYDGTFKFIKTGFMASTAQDPLSSMHSGTAVIIKAFRSKAVGSDVKIYASLKAGSLFTAFADLDEAFKSKEIVGLNGYEIGKPRPKQQNIELENVGTDTKSNEAILERLRQLYIDGEISKSDYVQRKAKLQSQVDVSARNQKPKNIDNEVSLYTIKPFTNNLEFKILSVIGSKAQQNIVINFQLKTNLVNQKIEINNLYNCEIIPQEAASAYDSFGKQYLCNNYSLGSQSNQYRIDNKLPTNVPLRGSITIANILPSISKFEYVNIPMIRKNLEGGGDCEAGTIEIRNLSINWK